MAEENFDNFLDDFVIEEKCEKKEKEIKMSTYRSSRINTKCEIKHDSDMRTIGGYFSLLPVSLI